MSKSSSARKNIVILGGSYGGVSTAHYLIKHGLPKLPDQGSYQVVLVSASAEVICRPACPRALISDDMFPQEKLFVGIPKIFAQYGDEAFRFIQGTATDLNHISRTVSVKVAKGDDETIHFHALVIATGASTPSPLHGLNRDADILRESWTMFRNALPEAKTIVIAGGGPAGVETAGELGEFLNGRPGWFTSKPASPKVAITIVTSGPRILPLLRPALAEQAETYLEQVGVRVIKQARLSAVSPEGAGTTQIASKATLTLDDGRTLEADLYIPATGTQPNTGFIPADLLAPDGRVETNPTTLRVDNAGPLIYAIGDVTSYARPAIHLILEAVPVLCTNIRRDLLQNAVAEKEAVGKDREFKEDRRETQLVPIGKSKGVGAMMGFKLPGFLVWLVKGRDYWLWTTEGLWAGGHWAKET